jgi:PEGA domain-containing protein
MIHKAKATVCLLAVWIGLQTTVLGEIKDTVFSASESQSSDRATFPAEYDRAWQVVLRMLSQYQFEFARRDKAAGRIETGYVVFSKHPTFSKLSNGVRTYCTPPKSFLKKWSDGRVKLVVELHRVSDLTTQVVFQPDIEGFAATRFDDTGVTGEWRLCRSNGKLESELLNDLAAELRKPQSSEASSPGPTDSSEKSDATKSPDKNASANSDVIFQSVPEGAEIYLNDKLIGMTPTRLSLAAGEYKVKFRKAGYKEYQKQFMLFPRSDITIGTEMDKESP